MGREKMKAQIVEYVLKSEGVGYNDLFGDFADFRKVMVAL